MFNQIQTVQDVKIFTTYLIQQGVNLHPDNDFTEYVNDKTHKPTYTKQEAKLNNKLMQQCFTVCKREGVDIYNTMLAITLTETGLDKFIPMP